jgi:hypothetical protein
MMRKYYCPISNEQFNQLINFGKVLIPTCLVVEHNDDSDLVQSNLVNTFINYLQFKYDEEYLVLEVNSHFKDEKEFQIGIHQVECVFPISEECSKAVTFKHSKIAFSNPIFSSDSLQKINDAFFISDSLNGAECLISIFKNIFEHDKVKNDNLIQSAFRFRKGHKLNSLDVECSIIDFTFLYTYQAYYPLTTLGYFFRTAEILARKVLVSKNKKIAYSHEILEDTDIYKLLEELKASKPESNLQGIINFLLTDSRASKFIENLTSEEIKYFIVIPMFLKIVDEFNDHNQNLEKTSLEKLVNYYGTSYKKECQQVVVWLGAYLGYGNCYDFFYLKSNLKILKSYQPIVIIQENQNISKMKLENNVEETIIKTDKDNSETVADKQNIQTSVVEETKIVDYEYETNKKNSESSTEAIKENTTLDNEQTVEVTKNEENKSEMVAGSESKTDEENSETSGIIKGAGFVVEKDVQIAKSEGIDVLLESVDEDQRIILALLNKKGACSLTELIKELKSKQKNTFDKDAVRNILVKMNNVELFTDKRTEKARIKPVDLFDIKD